MRWRVTFTGQIRYGANKDLGRKANRYADEDVVVRWKAVVISECVDYLWLEE